MSIIPYQYTFRRGESASLVFCPPPLGKPDPLKPRPDSGEDTRNRIIQKANPASCCTYYALNMLRNRFKAVNTEFSLCRRYEKIMSSFRKALMQHEDSLPGVCSVIDSKGRMLPALSMGKRDVDTPRGLEIISKIDAVDKGRSLSSVIEKFKTQLTHEDLYSFLYHLKFGQIVEICKDTIKQLDQPFGGDSWPQYQAFLDHPRLPEDQRILMIKSLILLNGAMALGLQQSKWDPRQSFDAFISHMNKEGPFVVNGHFGSNFYNSPPVETREAIESRKIFGWPKGSRIPYEQYGSVAHVVLLVGAQKLPSKNVVYFIDPNDISDPAHPEKQKIYAMTYETLTNKHYIADNLGFHLHTIEEEPKIADSSVGYALVKEKSFDSY